MQRDVAHGQGSLELGKALLGHVAALGQGQHLRVTECGIVGAQHIAAVEGRRPHGRRVDLPGQEQRGRWSARRGIMLCQRIGATSRSTKAAPDVWSSAPAMYGGSAPVLAGMSGGALDP